MDRPEPRRWVHGSIAADPTWEATNETEAHRSTEGPSPSGAHRGVGGRAGGVTRSGVRGRVGSNTQGFRRGPGGYETDRMLTGIEGRDRLTAPRRSGSKVRKASRTGHFPACTPHRRDGGQGGQVVRGPEELVGSRRAATRGLFCFPAVVQSSLSATALGVTFIFGSYSTASLAAVGAVPRDARRSLRHESHGA